MELKLYGYDTNQSFRFVLTSRMSEALSPCRETLHVLCRVSKYMFLFYFNYTFYPFGTVRTAKQRDANF